jgi:hypothetical protein
MVTTVDLADADLAALGAGRPSPATVARLRRAEQSRVLLLLREIARAAPGTTDEWYAQLVTAERHAPGPVREVLTYPLVGAWAAHCLAALRAGAPATGLDRLGVVTAVATAHAGLPAGPVPRPPRRLTATHGGLRLDVVLDDADAARGRLGLTPTEPLTDADAARWQALLREAWRLLVTGHRPWAQLIGSVLTCVVPVRPDARARGISATSAHAFGAVALSEPADATALAVGLLHETQHSLLNAVLHLLDLTDDAPERVYSPWRDDPRPVGGLLHGAYAYLGVTDFWRVRRSSGEKTAAFEFARWRHACAAAADDLLAGGHLTAAGVRFVSALRERLAPWAAEPVDPEIDRLARGANADHRARWRLRNLTVPPAAVTALAAAWRAGRAPARAGSVLAAPAGRALERSARLDLVHRRLRGAEPAGDPADVAWVRGDTAAATAGYRARLAADPHDDGAWAGLAVVTGGTLGDRPELVAAVCRATGAGPDAVAAWLTGPR